MKQLYVIFTIAIILLTSCSKLPTTNRNDNPQVAGIKNTNEPEYKRRTTPESVGAIQLSQLMSGHIFNVASGMSYSLCRELGCESSKPYSNSPC